MRQNRSTETVIHQPTRPAAWPSEPEPQPEAPHVRRARLRADPNVRKAQAAFIADCARIVRDVRQDASDRAGLEYLLQHRVTDDEWADVQALTALDERRERVERERRERARRERERRAASVKRPGVRGKRRGKRAKRKAARRG